jgi:hypothetical protein
MKKVILLALLMPYAAFGQIVENFESKSIVNWEQSTSGHWIADSVESLSGKFSLHHVYDNPDAGTDQIGIRIQNLHPSSAITKWSFLIRYGYDPSSLNNWSVLLLADKPPVEMSPETGIKGYALGVNLTGSDDTLRLWKVNGNQFKTVINCRINWQTDIGPTVVAKISVGRSPEGNWSVTVSRINGNIVSSGSGFDNELFGSGWFGIYYKYSSTRDRLLWFDDLNIEGSFFEDHEAPLILKCEPVDKRTVEITLNEEASSGMTIPENFSLNVEANRATSVFKKENLKYLIGFSEEFNNRLPNVLIVSKLCDLSGNCSNSTKVAFTPAWAERGDVIITEIMADPVPAVSLPEREYIEITNRTGCSLNLTNWKLSAASQFTSFPDCIIPASGICILCAVTDTLLYNKTGNVIGIKQFPVLNDDGKMICIYDSTGTLIHGVEYSSKWYCDDLKSNGGWSLEMKDTGYPFYGRENWIASVSRRGGTPGSVNSVAESNPDLSFFGIQNVFPEDSISLHVRFTEPVFDLYSKKAEIRIGETRLTDIKSTDPLFREFSFRPVNPLKKATVYELEMPAGISDFAGNIMQKCRFSFGLTEPAAIGDVLFNEILFNPFAGEPDYLELYNSSGKNIDVSRLQIGSINDYGVKAATIQVSQESRCLLPGSYYAITTDSKRISERYFSADPDHLFEALTLPTMSDDKGHLVLYNRELDWIDELLYSDGMHNPLLTIHEGISLEKTGPEKKSLEIRNWHSASEAYGWGTPGAPNSILTEMPSNSDKVVFSSTKITPDNDGFEDMLEIRMNLSGTGNVISVSVFDEAGNWVKRLASNLFAGADMTLTWDGTADDGSVVETGIYIILISVYDDSGKTEKWKRVCSVLRK